MKLLILLLACGPKNTSAPTTSAPSTEVAEVAEVAAPASLPTPYTAEQIRDAMPVGTRVRFRVEAAGQPTVEKTMVVTAADESTGTFTSQTVDPASGAVLKDEGPSAYPWAELREHAAFPASQTERADAEIELPMGRYATWVYTVTDPAGPVTNYWFATALPGPPVQMVVSQGEAELMRMTMIEHSAPGQTGGIQ